MRAALLSSLSLSSSLSLAPWLFAPEPSGPATRHAVRQQGQPRHGLNCICFGCAVCF